MITISEAQAMSSPHPFALVVSCDQNGKSNIMALSWWMYLSNKPASLGICLSNNGYTGKLLEANKEFSLCLVDPSLKDIALQCGKVSGKTVNKEHEFGIELSLSKKIAPSIIKDSPLVFECRVNNSVIVGDHTIYIAEIVYIHGDSSKLHVCAVDGYSDLKVMQ